MCRRKQRTALGYCRFSCASCHRRFNERTCTPFNELQYPTDIVLLAVLWRLRYKLRLRDVAELLLQRGNNISYETVRAWEFRFTPLISAQLRAQRGGQAGRSSCIDETYVKVAGRWYDLYRSIDRGSALLGSVRTQGSQTAPFFTMAPVHHAALTFSINSRHRDMNSWRRADNDAEFMSIRESDEPRNGRDAR